MASLQAQVDAVKAAVASPSTCTTATVVTLKKLILPESTDQLTTTTKSTTRTTKATASRTKTKADGSASKNQKEEALPSKERAALATHVINVTMKSLTEATKPAPPQTPAKRSPESTEQTGGRPRTLRRSLSAPLSPLQPRTLNRVATSPNIAAKAAKSAMNSLAIKVAPTIECARLAFACLRSAKGPIKTDQTDFQIESGMSMLVTKLLALGCNEYAAKELRMLKRRLEGPTAETTKPESQSLPDLLDFQKVVSNSCLAIVATCQIQALKLICASKKPAHIEGVLPFLRESKKLSPVNILSKMAKLGDTHAAKAARQMASLCQTLLSTAPSVSSNEDEVAMEPRLSPSPAAAFELQSMAFKTQIRWWGIAGHKGKAEEELISPYSRCLKCFVRRQTSIDATTYNMVSASFDEIKELIHSQKYELSTEVGSPMASIYQSLGTAAQSARQYEVAFQWFGILNDMMRPDQHTSVRISISSSRLLSVSLKRSRITSEDERLLRDVTTGLNASLSGTSQEVNELLENLSQARRSVAGLLMKARDQPNFVSTEMKGLLEDYLVKFPKFVARWLGLPPGKGAAAKQLVQFDTRRQTVMQLLGQVLDGALMIIKLQIQSQTHAWDSLDENLQDCLLLLQNAHDPTVSASRSEQISNYYTKISILYFSICAQARKRPNPSKPEKKLALQALNRSIETVAGCSVAEKEQAQYTTKLELFADICKSGGRKEDAIKSLRSICTHLIEDGVLANVTNALATNSPHVAWGTAEKASTLSRALRSIASLDDSWNDWTFFMPEAERATVLEHLVHVNTEASASGKPIRLHDPGMSALLRILTPERFPVRRLRVLLLVFAQQIGQHDNIDDVATLIDQTYRYLNKKDLGEDSGLASFIPHLRNFHTSLTVMGSAESAFPAAAVKDCVKQWSELVQSCATADDLQTIVDDPEGLLDHLLAVNQLAGLRGESWLQLSVLELCITIAKSCRGSNDDDLIMYNCYLASQYVAVGLFTQASKMLGDAKNLIKQHQQAAPKVMVDYYLAQAEYSTGINETQEALTSLSKANDIHSAPSSSWSKVRAHASLLRSQAALAQSVVALQKGELQEALLWGRNCVKWFSSEWHHLDGPSMTTVAKPELSLVESVLGKAAAKDAPRPVFGTRLWVLAGPLMKSLMQLSSVYSHIGMFQETLYFAESALRVAGATQSSMYEAEVNSWIASQYARAGFLEKGLPYLQGATDKLPSDASASRARISRQVALTYLQLGEEEKSVEYMNVAEEAVQSLGRVAILSAATSDPVQPPEKAVGKTAAPKKAPATRGTRTRAATTTTRAPRRTAAAKVKAPPPEALVPSVPGDAYQASLLASIILARAVGALQQEDWTAVSAALELVKQLPKLSDSSRQEQLIVASQHIGVSMEKMIRDPVFSVMQDSTISFPAVVNGSADKSPATQCPSPPRKGRGAVAESKSLKSPAFAEALKQAQEVLLEAQESAFSSGDNATLHRISSLLQTTVISLTATASSKFKSTIRSDLTTVAVELARNAAWGREQLTLQLPSSSTPDVSEVSDSTSDSLSNKMASLSLTADMASFQNEFIDMVPDNWSVISLSLSDSQHDLCITKFQAGHSPFILRLPLERASSRDADSEVFNFVHGREELLEIIKLANETSHSGGDMTSKAGRSAWWAEREALDERLKELLLAVETTWLGGFKGMFSQHERQSDLLARFQKTFTEILGRNLPSRQSQGRGRGKKTTKTTPPITLDSRILELFIGLGDPSEPDADFDEALNDLLYFVVDILQFHGERNAYDEIDFDAMVVDMYDALRGYHQVAKSNGKRQDGAHTVLVLDKALHAFPWESMPCMDGLAVSRVPSLACLRRLLVEAKMPNSQKVKGHYVSSTKGTYILNPSSDLKNTQNYFQSSFKELSSWRSIVNKSPKEDEFAAALSDSEILLYFGHGGGAQYIRGKSIRRLEKCRPASFLMGCSSAALTEAGEFECFGPVWNYMMAGCPAVVGTLWDVTDRDIDRFAGRVFEEWGLLKHGSFKDKEKQSSKNRGTQTEMVTGSSSLPEALSRSRDVCRMRYLNAAAVVMYGIPVYIEKDEDVMEE